ncbi:unnamed protein product [Linum trigynum]|uniref:ShKT domain-containing protein n=1 Tax=Linum trigynum TaxID=586398 RepID=A0AAV2GLX4_9ROSI
MFNAARADEDGGSFEEEIDGEGEEERVAIDCTISRGGEEDGDVGLEAEMTSTFEANCRVVYLSSKECNGATIRFFLANPCLATCGLTENQRCTRLGLVVWAKWVAQSGRVEPTTQRGFGPQMGGLVGTLLFGVNSSAR